MKPIKCPNCGKRMESQWEDVGNMTEGYFECTSCGVRGPRASAECPKTVICLSARLAREWIARIGTDTATHERGWVQGNRAAVYEVEVLLEKIKSAMKRIERKNT